MEIRCLRPITILPEFWLQQLNHDETLTSLICCVVDWSGSSLPGQLISSSAENDRIAARDVPAPPLSPDDFRSAASLEVSTKFREVLTVQFRRQAWGGRHWPLVMGDS